MRLKNGRVSVDSIKPTAGTTAFVQGLGIFIAFRYKPIARYVNIVSKNLLV